ncbi:uncharacterized protein [Procambarus clarkii]|uniref:uncharacterized protein n=1 Tax=Procambarus clarkii TaxID=6728 RepID=UPI0037444C79
MMRYTSRSSSYTSLSTPKTVVQTPRHPQRQRRSSKSHVTLDAKDVRPNPTSPSTPKTFAQTPRHPQRQRRSPKPHVTLDAKDVRPNPTSLSTPKTFAQTPRHPQRQRRSSKPHVTPQGKKPPCASLRRIVLTLRPRRPPREEVGTNSPAATRPESRSLKWSVVSIKAGSGGNKEV